MRVWMVLIPDGRLTPPVYLYATEDAARSAVPELTALHEYDDWSLQEIEVRQ